MKNILDDLQHFIAHKKLKSHIHLRNSGRNRQTPSLRPIHFKVGNSSANWTKFLNICTMKFYQQ